MEIIKFEAYSHALFNFSKKDSANRRALKTKFIFYSSLLFSKRKFSVKKSGVGKTLLQNVIFVVYNLPLCSKFRVVVRYSL